MYSAPVRLIRGTGPRPSPVAIYGSAPNRQDNGFGRPFVGDAGAVLTLFLRWWGVDRAQVFVSNIVKYWPGEDQPEPSPADIRRDAALLEAELEEVRPRLIIALGRVASSHFLGREADMDLMHGIPHPGINGLTVIPCYHPAAGLHDLQMAQRTWQDLRAACDYIQAPKREKVWVEAPKPVTVKRVRLHGPEIVNHLTAIDTEGRPGSPHSVQYSWSADYALVVSAEDARWLDFRGPVIFHNAKYDVRMLREMGVKLPPATLWEDTMIRAYCRQDLPHGLKALSYRVLRRPMSSFEDTVRAAFNPLALDYLEAVAACGGWARPDYELVEDRTTGRMRVYRPNPTNNRAKSILKTFAKKPDETKINELWFNIPYPQRQEVEDVLGPFPKFGIEIVPQTLADEYGGLDAARTLEIHKLLAPEPVPMVYRQDVETVPALVDCEVNGLPFSLERSALRAAEFKSEYESYREELRDLAGDDTFNPASPKQVHAILHGKWRIKSSRRTKLTGDDSWDKKALAILALQWAGREDPLGKKVQRFVYLLQEHRETVKLYGTYVGPDALPTQVKKGRIHAWLKNTMVVSGRLASEDPNLQNIPSRTKRGKLIRSCFVAPKGSVLLEVDYSQIELRVLADVSGDPALIAAFTGAEDLHRKTEKYIFGIPDDRAGEKRVAAKTFNFRIAYAGPNGSPRGLQEQLFLDGITLSVEACAEYRDRWFTMYPRVAAFLRASGDEARRHGFAATVGGRRRYLPFARLIDVPRARAEAERQAGNLKIQGYAQEVIKASMTRWDRWGRRKTNAIAPTLLCMQIHDSLVFEVGSDKPKVIADVARIILRMMLKGNEHFKVPILAEAKAGSDWGNLEKIKL